MYSEAMKIWDETGREVFLGGEQKVMTNIPPSPIKGYSMPSLTPGSISTSRVRSSFTSLRQRIFKMRNEETNENPGHR